MALQPMISLIFMITVLPVAAFAQDHGHTGHSATYSGFETREIKSLSEQDIEELRRGGGWGLASRIEWSPRACPSS